MRLVIQPLESWSDEEKEKMNEFKKFCSEERDGIPTRLDDCFRFLQTKAFDNEVTYNALMKRDAIIKQYFPATINSKVQQMLNDGFFHVSGRDKFNRPIVVVCPRVIF